MCTFPTTSREAQGACYAPSYFKSVTQRFGVDPQFLAPFRQAFGFIIMRNKCCVAFVACLLVACSPATVFRAVVAIVVDAIQGKTCGYFSHVRQKGRKFSPSIAYGYSSSAIISIVRAFRIGRTAPHICPDTVCAGQFASDRVTVRGPLLCHLACELALSTSTTFRASGLEAGCKDGFGLSALALAEPCRSSRLPVWKMPGGFNYSETPEGFSGKIGSSHDDSISVRLVEKPGGRHNRPASCILAQFPEKMKAR